MNLLDKIIIAKLLEDIEKTVDPLYNHILETGIPTRDSIVDKNYFLRLSLSLLPIIGRKITYNIGFRASIQNIKLKYYKRNLAFLEILADKQDLPINERLVFRIIRENLNPKNISEYIDIYELFETYRTKRITQYPPEQFLLYEPEAYYTIYKILLT